MFLTPVQITTFPESADSKLVDRGDWALEGFSSPGFAWRGQY